jgi:hypothetical protein
MVHCVIPSLGRGVKNPRKLECKKGKVMRVKDNPGMESNISTASSPPRPLPRESKKGSSETKRPLYSF